MAKWHLKSEHQTPIVAYLILAALVSVPIAYSLGYVFVDFLGWIEWPTEAMKDGAQHFVRYFTGCLLLALPAAILQLWD